MVEVVGQVDNRKRIDAWKKLPNFMIIEGEQGSGRKTLIRYIAEQFGADSILIGNKVSEIREVVEDNSALFNDRIYIIEGDTMSNGAKSSLLKITEEPPNRCHIALIVTSTQRALPTLTSRATVLSLWPYSLEDKITYLRSKISLTDERLYADYARMVSTLGEFQPLLDFGIEDVYTKVWSLYDSIWEVSDSNALNISSWMKLKKNDTDDKMDALMFLKALYNIGSWITVKESKDMSWEESHRHYNLLTQISKAVNLLKSTSASTEIIVNKWIRSVKSFG